MVNNIAIHRIFEMKLELLSGRDERQKNKNYDYSQGRFIPIYFDKQILPGTFKHTLHYLIDNEIAPMV